MGFLLTIFLPIFVLAASAGPDDCGSALAPAVMDEENLEPITIASQAIQQKYSAECRRLFGMNRQDLSNIKVELAIPLAHFARVEDEWILATLKDGQRPELDDACERDKALADAEIFLRSTEAREIELLNRVDALAGSLPKLEAEKEFFANREKAGELVECIDRKREELRSMEEAIEYCREQIGISDALWATITYLEGVQYPVVSDSLCMVTYPDKMEIADLFLETDGFTEKAIDKLRKETYAYIRGLNERASAYLPRIGAVRKKFSRWNCSEHLGREAEKLKKKIPRLTRGKGSGTGFVLKTANGAELVTADHVAWDRGTGGTASSMGISEGAVPVDFALKPGSFDRGADLVKGKAPAGVIGMEAVPDSYLPKLGDKIEIFGYPMNRKLGLTRHSCRYVGIAPNIMSRSPAYILHCPGAETHIGGMSGGPARTAEGKVLGANSIHLAGPNLVFVNPMSEGADGKIHFGLQKVKQAQCLTDDFTSTKPCQIIPGYTFEKVGP